MRLVFFCMGLGGSAIEGRQMEQIFQSFSKSKKFKTVAEHLNADGHRTENGALFTGQSVARILRDKAHLENGTVSQELWNEVQAILAARERSGGVKRRVAHLCSGLLHCGCGPAMYVPSNSTKYTCSKCRNKIAKDDLEVIVVENLRSSENENIRGMIHNWKSLSFDERREVVENTVQGIVAEDKKVTISLFAFG